MTSGLPAATTVQAGEIVDRIITILKRDLMLGADVELAADTPLFDGDLDLDSLDALMLMQSVEKEFNLKIPTESFGPDIFKDVNSIAAALGHHPHLGGTNSISPDSLSPNILDALPHRSPFRFLTEVTSVDPGTSATGHWQVTGDEAFFQGHFPGHPMVPGVLITEALAQLSGLVIFLDDDRKAQHSDQRDHSDIQKEPADTLPRGKLAHMDIRFRDSVAPPAKIILQSRLERSLGALVQFEVEAYVLDKRLAIGKLSLARAAGESDTPS